MEKNKNFANMMTGLLCLTKSVLQRIKNYIEIEEEKIDSNPPDTKYDDFASIWSEWPYNNHWLW